MFYNKIKYLFDNKYKQKLTQYKKRIVSSITVTSFAIILITVSNTKAQATNFVEAQDTIETTAGVSLALTNKINEIVEQKMQIEVVPNEIIMVGTGYVNSDETETTSVEFNSSDTINVGLNTDSEPLFQFDSTEYIEVDTQLESNVPNYEDGCKSYNFTFMDYKAVTSRNSTQYKILNADVAYTDETTGIRMYDGLYCVAVGTYYALPGDKIDVTMTNGTVFHCIVGDAKADIHTDATNRYQAQDGSVLEMIVDRSVFTGTSMYPKELEGTIYNISKLTL